MTSSSMTDAAQRRAAQRHAESSRAESGAALITLVLIQFLVTFNSTSGTLALPDATASLHLSTGMATWIVSGYILGFGGLLLLGGRLADLVGARRLLIISVIVFGAAAAVAGAAPSGSVLVGVRVIQGIGAAGMAPSALALLVTTFHEPAARRRVMGVWGAVAGAGAGLGVVGGGALTAWLGWRAALLMNVPFAVALLIAIPLAVAVGPRSTGVHASILGSLLTVLGVGALIAGLTVGSQSGWLAPAALILIPVGVILLIALGFLERNSAHPFLPRHLLARWPSAGGHIAMLMAGFTLYSLFVIASELLQTHRGFSPLLAGALIVPSSAASMLSASLAPRLIDRLGTVRPVVIGLVVIAVTTAAFAITAASGTPLAAFLPVMIAYGLGFGITLTSAISLALSGAAPAEVGAAGGLAQTGQQLGGAIGLTLVTTIIAGTATGAASPGAGYILGFGITAVIVAAGVAFIGIRGRRG